MNKVWIYKIIFYREDDEYGYEVYLGSETEVFPSLEAANRWKKDYETDANIEYVKERNWWYGATYRSSIEEKEILNY